MLEIAEEFLQTDSKYLTTTFNQLVIHYNQYDSSTVEYNKSSFTFKLLFDKKLF